MTAFKPSRKASPKSLQEIMAAVEAAAPRKPSTEEVWQSHRRSLKVALRNARTILQELDEVVEQAQTGDVRYTMDALRTAERQLEAAVERLAEANGLVGVEVV